MAHRASKCPIDGGDVTESSEAYELSNVVETALAKALVLAAQAKRCNRCTDPTSRGARVVGTTGACGSDTRLSCGSG